MTACRFQVGAIVPVFRRVRRPLQFRHSPETVRLNPLGLPRLLTVAHLVINPIADSVHVTSLPRLLTPHLSQPQLECAWSM